MQTAGIRSLLEPEYEFEFVEGRWPHLEGNWSLHTVDFSKSNVSIRGFVLTAGPRGGLPLGGRGSLLAQVPALVPPQREWVPYNYRANMLLKLYGFYNMLDIEDILATENELREVIEEHGPFDGLLGYS